MIDKRLMVIEKQKIIEVIKNKILKIKTKFARHKIEH